MTALHALALVAGIALVIAILVSALETVVMPRLGFTRLSRLVFAVVNRVLVHRLGSAGHRHHMLSLFAPMALVSLPLAWALLITGGFTFVFWGLNAGSLSKSFVVSGSSLFTLGFLKPSGDGLTAITFVEATIGLGLVALLISYLPTIYAAYNAREKGIKLLLPLAGSPPSALTLISRLQDAESIDMSTLWPRMWEWLLDLEQTHTSFPALCYFQSASSNLSWVAAAGTMLDTAAVLSSADLSNSAAGAQRTGGPMLVLAHGGPGLARIGRAAGLPLPEPITIGEVLVNMNDAPPNVSVSREEYETLLGGWKGSGEVGELDADRAWSIFAWLRSSYDRAVRGLAGLSHATEAPMTTDRPARVGRPRLVGNRPVSVDWTLGPKRGPGRS